MSVRKTFVIVSVSDRVDDLNKLLESIMSFKKFDEYDVNLCYQDYLGNADLIKYKDRYAQIIVEPQKMGCNGARIHLLKHLDYDIYVNLDDDMLLTEWTDYERSIEKALEESTGFVLTNWARSEKILQKKIPNMEDKFVKQIMIYQGGGMVYSEKIAKLIRELPVKKTMFDDIWCITPYVHGYTNYRYLGSLALHFTLGSGGMQLFMKEEEPELSAPQYINYRHGKREWLIPMDSDVNDYARQLHKENKK